jgi:FeoB-associated Cys-rich membrane protein
VVQEILVGLIVLAAAVVVVRRIMRTLRPPRGGEGCPSCASGAPCEDRQDASHVVPRA